MWLKYSLFYDGVSFCPPLQHHWSPKRLVLSMSSVNGLLQGVVQGSSDGSLLILHTVIKVCPGVMCLVSPPVPQLALTDSQLGPQTGETVSIKTIWEHCCFLKCIPLFLAWFWVRKLIQLVSHFLIMASSSPTPPLTSGLWFAAKQLYILFLKHFATAPCTVARQAWVAYMVVKVDCG